MCVVYSFFMLINIFLWKRWLFRFLIHKQKTFNKWIVSYFVMEHLPNVLVFGHSFIKRLERKTQTDQNSLKSDFGLKQCIVTLKGYGGLWDKLSPKC